MFLSLNHLNSKCSWNKQINPWQKFRIIHHNTYTKFFNQFSIQCDCNNVCTFSLYRSICLSFHSFTSYFALTQYIDSLYAHTQLNEKKHTIRCDDGCTTESHSEKFDLFSQPSFVCMLRCVCDFFIIEHGCCCGCLWTESPHYRMFGVCSWVYVCNTCYCGDDVHLLWQLTCHTEDGFYLPIPTGYRALFIYSFFRLFNHS